MGALRPLSYYRSDTFGFVMYYQFDLSHLTFSTSNLPDPDTFFEEEVYATAFPEVLGLATAMVGVMLIWALLKAFRG